ncbi:MAG: glycosyltransferase [Reichenbachiella sp.]
MPTISVLLPVYNAEATLERAVFSLLNQTYIDFELIIIDNGSSDGTSKLVRKFNDARIKSYWLEKNDLVEALNFGLEKCSSAIVARMDADDFAYPKRLEVQFNFLVNNPDVDLVSGWVKYQGDRSENVGYATYVDWTNSINTSSELYLSRFQESALPHPSVMFRKKLITKYGGYKNNTPEDFELWNRWFANGVRMAKVDEFILDWHDAPSRLSRNDNRYDQLHFAAVKSQYFKLWFDRKFKEVTKPDLFIFGYSKVIKQKTIPLIELGLKIKAYLDIQLTKSPNTIFYKEIEGKSNCFVLSYVSDRKGKLAIKN